MESPGRMIGQFSGNAIVFSQNQPAARPAPQTPSPRAGTTATVSGETAALFLLVLMRLVERRLGDADRVRPCHALLQALLQLPLLGVFRDAVRRLRRHVRIRASLF